MPRGRPKAVKNAVKTTVKDVWPPRKAVAEAKTPPSPPVAVETVPSVEAVPSAPSAVKAKPRIRVCVPYPNHGAMKKKTSESLKILAACPDVFVEVLEVQGSSISHSRNAGIIGGGKSVCVKQKFSDFDYYLSLDADIAFTPEQLLKLIGLDKDVVGGAYIFRQDADKLVAGYFSNYGTVEFADFLNATATGVKEVDWIGGGFTLIKAKVLEAMDFPYYREEIVNYTAKSGDECGVWVGEDVGFCMGAKRAGFKIYCDCDCKVEHLIKEDEKPLFQFNKEQFGLEETTKIAMTFLDYCKNIVASYHQKIGQQPKNPSLG
jgi:hypothetical protein